MAFMGPMDDFEPMASLLLRLTDPEDSLEDRPLVRCFRLKGLKKIDAPAKVDWLETPDEHVFEADLPGLTKNDITLILNDAKILKVAGERIKAKTSDDDKWHQVERNFFGSFEREFHLPKDADVGEIQAKMDKGVLTVSVRKIKKLESAANGGKKIEIA